MSNQHCWMLNFRPCISSWRTRATWTTARRSSATRRVRYSNHCGTICFSRFSMEPFLLNIIHVVEYITYSTWTVYYSTCTVRLLEFITRTQLSRRRGSSILCLCTCRHRLERNAGRRGAHRLATRSLWRRARVRAIVWARRHVPQPLSANRFKIRQLALVCIEHQASPLALAPQTRERQR